VIYFNSIIDHCDHCRELFHDELDLVIKALLLAHRFNGQHTQAKKHKSGEREKAHQKVLFQWIAGLQTYILFCPWYTKQKTASHSYLF